MASMHIMQNLNIGRISVTFLPLLSQFTSTYPATLHIRNRLAHLGQAGGP